MEERADDHRERDEQDEAHHLVRREARELLQVLVLLVLDVLHRLVELLVHHRLCDVRDRGGDVFVVA